MYEWIEALHLVAVMSWMAGMLYLPRLFVYHADAKVGSELSETLKIMERRLLRYIVNPAMCVTVITGVAMLILNQALLKEPFMWVKLSSVCGLIVAHIFFARYRRAFAEDRNQHRAKYFRILNEVPTLLMILIVIMVIVHPWA